MLTIFQLAGEEGFEPPNAGTRNQCLTTWRLPIEPMNRICGLLVVRAIATRGDYTKRCRLLPYRQFGRPYGNDMPFCGGRCVMYN